MLVSCIFHLFGKLSLLGGKRSRSPHYKVCTFVFEELGHDLSKDTLLKKKPCM